MAIEGQIQEKILFTGPKGENFSDFLSDHYLIEICSAGEECLKTIEKSDPDLIILDLNMSDMDGHETCENLRKIQSLQDTPIIFLTNSGTIDEKLEGFEAGGDDYITLPSENHNILRKIKRNIKHKNKLEHIKKEVELATSVAYSAMSATGDVGVILRFLEDSFSCSDVSERGRMFLEVVEAFGLSCSLQINYNENFLYFDSDGEIRDLEKQVIEKLSQQGRYISFGRRAVVN